MPIRTLALILMLSTPLHAQKPDDMDLFEKKIRPVLAEKCYGCHSASSPKPMSGLRLDTREGIRKCGNSGMPAVTPKDLAHSSILSALRHDGPLKMPPGAKLSSDVVADFETWIKSGAADPREGKLQAAAPAYDYEKARQHWSYQPVRKTEPPRVSDAAWNNTSIDRFIKAELEKRKLRPVALADRRALLRRATLDLTESDATFELYGLERGSTKGFGWQALVARRLDKPVLGLLQDMKSRGLLNDTLIVWTTEFGRTPWPNAPLGRGHNPKAFSSWMAGAGVQAGMVYGASDEIGEKVASDGVHVHDFHATILHLLGFDHTRLTYRHAGRDYRLTDVDGNVVKPILA